VKNAYRVLLTRARQGMVIFVPRGVRWSRKTGQGVKLFPI